MSKVFAEIGFGNESFLSTEFEEGDKEFRVKKFKFPNRLEGVYFRFWVMKKEIIIASNEGIIFRKRDKNKIKFLFGVSGRE